MGLTDLTDACVACLQQLRRTVSLRQKLAQEFGGKEVVPAILGDQWLWTEQAKVEAVRWSQPQILENQAKVPGW